MGIISEAVKDKQTVAILGHVSPDGDCVGSCMGMYHYLTENFEGLEVTVFLESTSRKFEYIDRYMDVCTEFDPEKRFDLCITLDASDEKRLGEFAPYLEQAADSLCIDHHVTNQGIAHVNVVDSVASSCCEVLYGLLEPEKISRMTAICLYTGIIHDSGVFRFSNTSRKTLEIAGRLLEYGFDFPKIIDGSFYMKSYNQSKLHGQAMLDSERILDGRCIYTVVTQEMLKKFDCTLKATDGIVDQLRVVEGVEVVILMYETGKNDREFKVSMRTNTDLDLARITAVFGGGGHVKAAGCTMVGEPEEILAKIVEQIEMQWSEN